MMKYRFIFDRGEEVLLTLQSVHGHPKDDGVQNLGHKKHNLFILQSAK
jgi:hypothetical protein